MLSHSLRSVYNLLVDHCMQCRPEIKSPTRVGFFDSSNVSANEALSQNPTLAVDDFVDHLNQLECMGHRFLLLSALQSGPPSCPQALTNGSQTPW